MAGWTVRARLISPRLPSGSIGRAAAAVLVVDPDLVRELDARRRLELTAAAADTARLNHPAAARGNGESTGGVARWQTA